ncbi:MAG: ROK family protein [Bacteroidaceae bacterium]|nr:ROK family protein [Bacteroidaceae bacterium]
MMTYSIGIDIGGTNTDIGLVSSEGRCLARKNLQTAKYFDAELYVKDICLMIEELKKDNDVKEIDGIGIAAPLGNYYTGCIENATNLNFKGIINLRLLFAKYTESPITVSNDANAAAYGELVYGGARGMKNFIMFTLGTGVGSGIVIDGKLVHGKTGSAGELGHVILIPGGRKCGCGRCGCLETYASGTGIKATMLEVMSQHPEYRGVLAQIPRAELTSKSVGDAANAGDPLAIEVFEKTGEWLGLAMANAVAFSSPEAVFLMGGPVKAGEVLLRPTRASFQKNLCFVYDGSVGIKVSELPHNDAAILGAAALTKA